MPIFLPSFCQREVSFLDLEYRFLKTVGKIELGGWRGEKRGKNSSSSLLLAGRNPFSPHFFDRLITSRHERQRKEGGGRTLFFSRNRVPPSSCSSRRPQEEDQRKTCFPSNFSTLKTNLKSTQVSKRQYCRFHRHLRCCGGGWTGALLRACNH